MSSLLNAFEVNLLDDEDLVLWNIPNITGQELKSYQDSYDIYIDYVAGVAYPMTNSAADMLNQLGFEQFRDNPEKRIRAFAHLSRYGFAKKLMEEGLTPVHADQRIVRANRVRDFYQKNDPLYEFNELYLLSGLRVGARYWTPPNSSPFVGLTARYTTTKYFAEPLSSVIESLELNDFYVQMKCDPFCNVSSCPFYGESRLMGKFNGFVQEGSPCRYGSVTTGPYARISNTREGIESNPPATRVSMERSDALISRWAYQKYEKKNMKRELDQYRGLATPEGRQNRRKVKHFYELLKETIKHMEKRFELPNGQRVEFEESMLEIEGV